MHERSKQFPYIVIEALNFVSFCVSLYLAVAFLTSSDLRELQNYPVFMTNIIDCLATGPGFMGFMLTSQVARYHPSQSIFFKPSSFTRYTGWRDSIREKFLPKVVYQVNIFWWRCLPDFLIMRVNEYGTGMDDR
ncbi:uncharacterized protein LOC134838925 [Symsagittifera roscoffensis]|uniref:uncharacterized protein LOC134838925 n=1 Tax=Symsagittifera roscoffensis TaxID=84072 RepID=UPI00307CAFFB